ncbi:MAG: bifunctional (p)ppGpp synthetase/guanosine-3',5'-bis(diphosphate) 3'-pyrophosphohydrolase [Solobacterium sp.]|nr:bifunctional (p)ppGpp synthetase/guanosine-3',5'-bis(diphosphate) 3'-pyrophosphohydrolase [Solobacterium sp.]
MAEKKQITMDDIRAQVHTYLNEPSNLELIEHAASFAEKRHEHQKRKSGEPYFVHLMNVAYILAELHTGPETVAAGFLHDTIEDTGITKEELAKEFNPDIAEIVDSVTKIGALKLNNMDEKEYQASNHRKIFIAMAKDIRVILVKLADRLHNMRTLQFKSEASQKRIARETLDVYAPIAHRLGISTIKNELEDLCFFYLDREEYYHVAKLVEMKKAERDESVQQMIRDISALLQEHNIEFNIFGRSKHLYSIYHKMTERNKRFDEILDLLAIRIVTKTELNCYEILGYIHANYRPIPGRLKDYIAMPKVNMYQSLHTTIIGPDGRIYEIQIRTEEMDDIAEKGIAAHWKYKEGTNYNSRREQKEMEEKLFWFRDFVAYTGESQDASASEYMETLQRDIFEANVYVMTPRGKVIDLPNGATPIDFAYRIHTDVGNQAVGAIVNETMVPLNTELHTGDVVQIKTMKGTGPSEDWLKFVKTNQAKSRIRAYLTKKETEEKQKLVPEGERMLRDELRKRGFDPEDWMDKKKLEPLLTVLSKKTIVDLFYAIAVRSLTASQVAEKLTNQKRPVSDEELEKFINRDKRRTPSKSGVYVPGIESMKISLAQCCMPVYGDKIVGFITKGEGVKVHRADCPSLKRGPKKFIDVKWEDVNDERMFDCNLIILAKSRNFLLTDVVTAISQMKAPMVQVNANMNQETLITTIKMKVQVHNAQQVDAIAVNLKKVDSILEVKRDSN